MSSGERPIGAAKGKQSDTEALCQPPPPPAFQDPPLPTRTDTVGWSSSGTGREHSRDRWVDSRDVPSTPRPHVSVS